MIGMDRRLSTTLLVAITALLPACQRGPFRTAGVGQGPNANPNVPPHLVNDHMVNAQVQEMQRRLTELDENNRDLHSKLANSERDVQGMREELTVLRTRLRETVDQLRDEKIARQDAETRVAAIQSSMPKHIGATLKPNSSLETALKMVQVQIPGVSIRQDGDEIRFELPADTLFPPGSTSLHPQSHVTLRQVAGIVAQHYPRQRIGIEGHIDTTPGVGPASLHQITGAQSMAVFQFLASSGLPTQQLAATAHGSNRPRVSNGSEAGRAKNRRVEIVIHPETY